MMSDMGRSLIYGGGEGLSVTHGTDAHEEAPKTRTVGGAKGR
jgi:hypothetical protein